MDQGSGQGQWNAPHQSGPSDPHQSANAYPNTPPQQQGWTPSPMGPSAGDSSYAYPNAPNVSQPSGDQVSMPGLLMGAGVVGVVGLLLAVIYPLGIVYIPFVKLRILMPLLFGAGIGSAAGLVLPKLGVTKELLIAAVALVAAGVAYMISWPVWIYFAFRSADVTGIEFTSLLLPQNFIDAVALIYENGTWTLGRGETSAVSGIMLAVVWVIEFLMIVITAPIAAFGAKTRSDGMHG